MINLLLLTCIFLKIQIIENSTSSLLGKYCRVSITLGIQSKMNFVLYKDLLFDIRGNAGTIVHITYLYQVYYVFIKKEL